MGTPKDDRWADLWDRHADDVYAYALRRVGPDDAPDVVAEVFTAAMTRADRVPDDALPWLYRTAWIVPAPRRRRTWIVAVAAAVVVLALVIGVALVTAAADSSPTKPVSDIQRLAHDEWRRLPESPISPVGRAQLLSTNKGILLWGEYSDAGTPPGFHLALYNPATKQWKKLAEPPVVLTQEGVWTGHDLVFPRASLAYDAAENRWRKIAPAPFVPDSAALATWTGNGVYLVTPICTVDAFECSGSARWQAATYDPASDRWAVVPPPSLGHAWQAIASVNGRVTLWGIGPEVARQTFAETDARDGWRSSSGSSEPATGPGALVAVGDGVIWIGWSDGPGALLWRKGRGPLETSLPHPGICAVRPSPGPRRSAAVWCSTTESLHMLDVARDRWFELPSTHISIEPNVLWSRGSLYAMAADGHLLALG